MKVDFYILDTPSGQQSLFYTCGLIEKCYADKQPVYVHVSSSDEAERLDTLLWTFRDDSFVPHNLYQEKSDVAVQIGYGTQVPDYQGILINLAHDIPTFYLQFQQLIEIVFASPSVQQAGRERYRHYREQNFALTTHKIRVNEA